MRIEQYAPARWHGKVDLPDAGQPGAGQERGDDMTVLTNAEGREWRDSVLAKSALYRKLLAERSQAIKSGMPTPALHCVNAHSKVAAVAGVRVHHAGCNTGVERKPPSRSGRRNSKVSVYSGRLLRQSRKRRVGLARETRWRKQASCGGRSLS